VIAISLFEYDRRVAELTVDDALAEYFREKPEKKELRYQELDRLEDEVAFANIRSDYRVRLLSEIKESKARLRLPDSQNQYNPYQLVGLGIVIGIILKTGFDYAVNKFLEMKDQAYRKGQEKALHEDIKNL
jgi:hypothetical protein